MTLQKVCDRIECSGRTGMLIRPLINDTGVYRVNLGVRKDTFVKLFGAVPKRPGAGGVVEMDYDFSAADCFLPHPVYAWMGWMCVLNPSEETFEALRPYIREAYEYAKEKFAKRK